MLSPLTGPSHFGDMGTLRLFLALSVVTHHLEARRFGLVHGATAVVLFYIISGFYMAMVLNEKYCDDTLGFYRARFRRIYPAYWATAVGMVLLHLFWIRGWHSVISAHHLLPPQAVTTLAAMNVAIFGQSTYQMIIGLRSWAPDSVVIGITNDYFPEHFFEDRWMLVGQAWTLAVELSFYLVAPLIVKSIRRTLIFFCASLVIRIAMITLWPGTLHAEVWGYYLLPTTLCLFLTGSLSYRIWVRARSLRCARMVGSASLALLLAFLTAEAALNGQSLSPNDHVGFDTPTHWLFYGVFALALPFIFERFKRSRLDRLVGDLSYPLYLVHGVTIGLVVGLVNGGHNSGLAQAEAVLASIMVAAVLHAVVEVPLNAIRDQRMAVRAPA